jgi:hypothetical protein
VSAGCILQLAMTERRHKCVLTREEAVKLRAKAA